MNILLNLIVIGVALWVLNGIRKQQKAMEADMLEALEDLHVTLPYLDIPRKLTVPHIQAHYDLVRKMRIRMIVLAIVGILSLVFFTNTTSVRLSNDEQMIKVITRNPVGLPLQHYDLMWHGSNELNGNWMWRTAKQQDESFGLWKPADVPLINGDRFD
jgi:hypothetical protein